MQKIGVVTAMAVWFMLAVKLIVGNVNESVEIAKVFSEQDFIMMEGEVRGFGEYGVTHLTEAEKEQLLVSLASGLGVEPEYSITDTITEKTSEKILTKSSKYADTTIKVVTVTEDVETYYQTLQYVEICLNLHENIDCATTYRDLISDLFEAEEIDGTVMINLKGTIDGALNYSEKNKVANAILNRLDAEVISENRGGELFTIYAYSDLIEDSIISAGKKVNINISEDYNETENKTVIYFSTPLNNLDY